MAISDLMAAMAVILICTVMAATSISFSISVVMALVLGMNRLALIAIIALITVLAVMIILV